MRLHRQLRIVQFVVSLLLLGLPFSTPAAMAYPRILTQGIDAERNQIQFTPIVFASATNTPTRTPTPINVGNFVWDDIDHDGRQDAGEPGLAGVSVQLWNSTKTALLDSAVTNANGNYTLIAPTPGSYRIRVLLPNSIDQFSPKDGANSDDQLDSDINPSGTNFGFTDIYTFGSNLISITTIDTGIIIFRTPTPTRTPTPINIGNFIWDDLDSDGRQDAGEPGLAGVSVQLWNSAKNDLIASTTTNSNGNYTLVAPVPGNYRIRVLLPGASDNFSPKDQASGDNQLDSDINPSGTDFGFTDVFNLASNVISTTIMDAGIIRFRTPTPTRTPTPINIGNFVWHDLDGDGVQDPGEPGLAGVIVQLWNEAKTDLIASTTTNANGNYTLIAPFPGAYRVRVLPPNAGASFTLKDQGLDSTDSDINPSGTNLGFTDSINIASNVISITTIDAGLIGTIITHTPTFTHTATRTNTPTSTKTSIPTSSKTNTSTSLPTGSKTNTPTGTLLASKTNTPTVSKTHTTTPTKTHTPNRTPSLTPTFQQYVSLIVNFQPASSVSPNGYMVDAGSAFGMRGSGYSHGWNTAVNTAAFERNIASDQRYDTGIPFPTNSSAFWQIALPNGQYDVFLAAGDPAITSGRQYVVTAQGITIVNGTPSVSQFWVQGSARVTVSNGMLRLQPGTGGAGTPLLFIHITAVNTASTPTATLQPTRQP